jgi:hypothetical protein
METLGLILSVICSIVSLVCYVLVLIQMFQRGKTGLAIACIVLLCVCGIGGLIAFIYGWMKSSEWGLKNIMLAWTAAIILNIVGNVLNPGQFQNIQAQFQKG